MTMYKIFSKLRNYNKKNYVQMVFCVTLSVMLITSYGIMMFSPTVMQVLPEGGDSRKQAYMIFAIALIGCFIFTIYAAGLFFKYKSREAGVFLALGTKKSQLRNALFAEIGIILSACTAAGLALGAIVSYFVWQMFCILVVDNDQMKYQADVTGFIIGFVFALVISACIMGMAVRFIKRTNLMDVLNDHRKSEPLRDVTKLYGILGIVFSIMGFVLGYVVPVIVAEMGVLLPSVWSATYLLSLAGIYMVITYAIVHHERGKRPQRYYRNIISVNMMKFQGKQTVRNMCIISLLVAASLYACFYAPGMLSGISEIDDNPVDFSIPSKVSFQEVNKEDIEKLADDYQIKMTGYREGNFAELLASGVSRDWDDNNNLIEDYMEKYAYSKFMSASDYRDMTGEEIQVEQGTFYRITFPQQQNGFWDKFEDMDLITNPVTEEQMKVKFAGTAAYEPLMINGVNSYILNDEDYRGITKELPDNRMYHQILFNIQDSEAAFDFSTALYGEILKRAPREMQVQSGYNEYQEQLAIEAGEEYSNDQQMEMSPDNQDLMGYWKFYPNMKVMKEKTFFQTNAVFFMLFIYVAIICLAAVGIIAYTRSVTIGMNNKQLFDDLKKLGGNHKYLKKCITSQLMKIYALPVVIGSILIYIFTLMTYKGNDGVVSSTETWALGVDFLLVLGVSVYMYVIYRASLRKIEGIIGNKNH